MNPLIEIILLSIFLVLFDSTVLYSIKRFWTDPTQYRWMILAMVLYGIIVPICLYKALSYAGIGMVNFFWNICSIIIGFLIGIHLFKEQVTLLQILGITFCIIGIVLLLIHKHRGSSNYEIF
jgi:drug/metabolite transporter (DMT)-like permease